MKLGTYEFQKLPAEITPLEEDKITAHQETYSSVAFFSWGLSYIGKIIELRWPFLSIEDYESIRELFVADVPVVFDPEVGSETPSFNVEILSFTGAYFLSLGGEYRKGVSLQLLIMSEVE